MTDKTTAQRNMRGVDCIVVNYGGTKNSRKPSQAIKIINFEFQEAVCNSKRNVRSLFSMDSGQLVESQGSQVPTFFHLCRNLNLNCQSLVNAAPKRFIPSNNLGISLVTTWPDGEYQNRRHLDGSVSRGT